MAGKKDVEMRVDAKNARTSRIDSTLCRWPMVSIMRLMAKVATSL